MGNTSKLKLRLAFAAMATLTAALPETARSSVAEPPHLPTPEQQQDYETLEGQLALITPPYLALQKQFDAREVTADEYRAGVAALDANLPPGPPHAANLPAPSSLDQHVTGCTTDGYSVNIPVSLSVDLGSLSQPPAGNDQPVSPPGFLLSRLEESVRDALRDFSLHAFASADRATVGQESFSNGLQATLDRITADTGKQTGLKSVLKMGRALISENYDCGARTPSP